MLEKHGDSHAIEITTHVDEQVMRLRGASEVILLLCRSTGPVRRITLLHTNPDWG